MSGDDAKSARVRAELLDWLVEAQRGDGSWGSVVADTFAPLALMSSDRRKHRQAVEKSARFHGENTYPGDRSGLVNWRYCAAGIVLAEYYLATEEKWALAELQE